MEGLRSGATVSCACLTTGPGASSHRAESQGPYSIALFLAILGDMFQVERGHVKLGCDNDAVIRSLRKGAGRVRIGHKDSDVLRATLRLLIKLPLTVTFEEVTGHLDEAICYDLLSPMEKLNVDCDRLAKAHLALAVRASRVPPRHLPTEGLYCYVGERKVTTSCSGLLRDWAGRAQARQYWHRQGVIPRTAFDLIDWGSVRANLAGDPVLFRMWWAKHLTGFCATGRQMCNRGEWESPRCPCCEQEVEGSTRHMWACTHPEM